MKSNHNVPAFAAFQHSDFRWIWSGQLISEVGSQMQLVAINWHIYILTHSPVALGLIGLFRVVPTLTLSLVGGVYADAHDRRRILILTQSITMILAGILAVFNDVGGISVGIVYVLAAAIAGTEAFNSPAWQAIVPNLVPKEHLMNALSLNSVMKQTASIVGPVLAGFIIAWKGVAAVYLINMVSFLAVLVAIVRMKSPAQKNLGASHISFSAINEGLHFLRRSPVILSISFLDFFSNFFSSATTLLPIFATEILKVGPQGLGILQAGQSTGSILSAVGLSWIGDFKRKGRLVFSGFTIYATATVVFGASQWFAVSFIALMMVGAGDTISGVLRKNIVQMETPDRLRGRLTSVVRLFANGGPQLGNLEAGLVAALIGAPLSVITGGIANLVFIGLLAWKIPKLLNYDS